jgi:hypothetical protein
VLAAQPNFGRSSLSLHNRPGRLSFTARPVTHLSLNISFRLPGLCPHISHLLVFILSFLTLRPPRPLAKKTLASLTAASHLTLKVK